MRVIITGHISEEGGSILSGSLLSLLQNFSLGHVWFEYLKSVQLLWKHKYDIYIA